MSQRARVVGLWTALSISFAAMGNATAWGQSAPPPASNTAGHALAERFAKEAAKPDKEELKRKAEAKKRAEDQRRRVAAERRKADESDMLARAREEADERRAAQEAERVRVEAAEQAARVAEEQRQAEAARVAEEQRRAAEQQRIADERRAAEEARIAQQRAEEERRRVEEARLAEEKRKADALRVAEERRLADERRQAEERRVAEEQRIERERRAEAERLAAEQTRRDAEQRAAEAQRLAAERERLAAEAAARADDERRQAEVRDAESRRRAEQIAAEADEARRAAMTRDRDEEARRMTDALRRGREAQSARIDDRIESAEVIGAQGTVQPLSAVGSQTVTASTNAPVVIGKPQPMPTSVRNDRDWDVDRNTALAPTERVAVLLVMEPGNRGIRRHNKTADPVLCGDGGCYVSNGTAAPASLLATNRALGFGRTWGSRAGACNNSLGCVFRDVDLTALRGRLQPVDMRLLRHDRREAVGIDATSACKAKPGAIACRNGVHGSNYTMWIVPEVLAKIAGPEALQAAVDHELSDDAQTAASAVGWR